VVWPRRKAIPQRTLSAATVSVSLYNFKTVEPALFKELAALARKGAERFRQGA
jgi:hypothetical protein